MQLLGKITIRCKLTEKAQKPYLETNNAADKEIRSTCGVLNPYLETDIAAAW